jgi:hypothetical protein
MLAIVVCLEERDAQIELKHNATYRPDITRLRPSQLENDLRCSIVTCGYDCAVMLVIESCTAKVNQPNIGRFNATDFPIL